MHALIQFLTRPFETSYSKTVKDGDIYDSSFTRNSSEKISSQDVLTHWEARSQRPGLQSVLSVRYSMLTNAFAHRYLQRETFKFLNGYIENKSIFELGIGIGRMTRPLSKKASRIVGIDFSSGMVARAQKSLQKQKNVEVLHGEITDHTFPEKSFDLVFSSIVLLHILDPQKLQTTAKAMKKFSDIIFIMEPIPTEANKCGSKYSIARSQEEYEALFAPYKLVKKRAINYVKDDLMMMLFKKDY